MSKTHKTLLATVIIIGTVLLVLFSCSYLSARHELSVLKISLNESTAVWKQINEEKLIIQQELKEARNELRNAELTVAESEERAASLQTDIETLEKEIHELKTQLDKAE